METTLYNSPIIGGPYTEVQESLIDINEDLDSQKKELEELTKNVPYSLSVALIKISQLHGYEPMDIDTIYQKILPAFPLLRRNDGSKYQSHSVHTVRSAMVSNKLYLKDEQGRYVLNIPNAIKIIRAIKIKKKVNNKEKEQKPKKHNINNNNNNNISTLTNIDINNNNNDPSEKFISYDSQNIDTSNISDNSVLNIPAKKPKVKKIKETKDFINKVKIEKYEKTFLVLKNLLETSESDNMLYSQLDLDLTNLSELSKLPQGKLNADKMMGMLCVFKFFKPFLESSLNSVHCQENIMAKLNDLTNEVKSMENLYNFDNE